MLRNLSSQPNVVSDTNYILLHDNRVRPCWNSRASEYAHTLAWTKQSFVRFASEGGSDNGERRIHLPGYVTMAERISIHGRAREWRQVN